MVDVQGFVVRKIPVPGEDRTDLVHGTGRHQIAVLDRLIGNHSELIDRRNIIARPAHRIL